MSLFGRQFDDIPYKATEWSDLENMESFNHVDLGNWDITDDVLTLKVGARMRLGGHTVKVVETEKITLTQNGYINLVIDPIGKDYTIKFSTTKSTGYDSDTTSQYEVSFMRVLGIGSDTNHTPEDSLVYYQKNEYQVEANGVNIQNFARENSPFTARCINITGYGTKYDDNNDGYAYGFKDEQAGLITLVYIPYSTAGNSNIMTSSYTYSSGEWSTWSYSLNSQLVAKLEGGNTFTGVQHLTTGGIVAEQGEYVPMKIHRTYQESENTYWLRGYYDNGETDLKMQFYHSGGDVNDAWQAITGYAKDDTNSQTKGIRWNNGTLNYWGQGGWHIAASNVSLNGVKEYLEEVPIYKNDFKTQLEEMSKSLLTSDKEFYTEEILNEDGEVIHEQEVYYDTTDPINKMTKELIKLIHKQQEEIDELKSQNEPQVLYSGQQTNKIIKELPKISLVLSIIALILSLT